MSFALLIVFSAVFMMELPLLTEPSMSLSECRLQDDNRLPLLQYFTLSEYRLTTIIWALFIAFAVFLWRMAPTSESKTIQNVSQRPSNTHDPVATDPPLLQKTTSIKSFATSSFTYPGIRVFFQPHKQIDKLPRTPAPLPLLVFIHGLGGSVAQFHPLLVTLTNIASCLAIDFPGCGMSEFSPTNWDAYTPEALLELLEVVIEQHRNVAAGQKVVLIGHSMGTALAAGLATQNATSKSQPSKVSQNVAGIIAICPPPGPPNEEKAKLFTKLLYIPEFIFNLWRWYDARGGPESASVKRFVGGDADPESKHLQNRFNRQSRTPVWRRMAWGVVPTSFEDGKPLGGMPGEDAWRGLHIPVFLVAGDKDNVTPPEAIETLERWINAETEATQADVDLDAQQVVAENGQANGSAIDPDDIASSDEFQDDSCDEGPTTPLSTSATDLLAHLPPQPSHPTKVVLKHRLDGTHALLYTPTTARVLAALISDFLSTHITPRYQQSWQLQHLTREGKWDVKNLEKWRSVEPVSNAPIGGIFRAMKTLREVDELHTPREFVKAWGGRVKDVVDISHDVPVYDVEGLEGGGVRYHKFPTVSKIPPTEEDVGRFVGLVDRLRGAQAGRAEAEGWVRVEDGGQAEGDDSWNGDGGEGGGWTIGVHCHYGFNRTGFFIVSYLVERCEMGIEEAIEEFARARPNGIRHQHFLDTLFMRYSACGVGGKK